MPYVGLLTRVISWAVDVLLINLVAIIVGLGVELIVVHLSDHEASEATLRCDRGWRLRSLDGRLLRRVLVDNGPDARFSRDAGSVSDASGGKVKPVRALVRWIGMSLAMVPLPWGYVPIPFKRLGFPDWLAHTRVIEAEQLSIAAARQEKKRQRATSPDGRLPR